MVVLTSAIYLKIPARLATEGLREVLTMSAAQPMREQVAALVGYPEPVRVPTESRASLMQRSVRTVRIVKSVRGAVPVFRPVRFLGPLPEPAGRLSPQRALRTSQVGCRGGYAAAGQGAGMAAPR